MSNYEIVFSYDRTQPVNAASYINNNNPHFNYKESVNVVNSLLDDIKQTVKTHIAKGFDIKDLNGAFISTAGCTVMVSSAEYDSEKYRYIVDAELTVDPSLADKADYVSELL